MKALTLRFLGVALLCLACASCQSPQPAPPAYQPVFTPSQEAPLKVPEGYAYTFGYLEVPEDRASPQGRTVKLPVYIFKCRGENCQPDPLVYTAGGPGSTSLSIAPWIRNYPFLENRDFILFEQRGTQYAQPRLDCPQWHEALTAGVDPALSDADRLALKLKAAESCRDSLQQAGIDLGAYTTADIAADLEDLRLALNIQEWNLLTLSYSTRIGQTMMREYPEHLRSVILDCTLPWGAFYDEESNANLVAAFNSLFDDCARDPECNAAFPGLKQRWWAYLQEKTAEPLRVNIVHPTEDRTLEFALKGKDIINFFDISSSYAIPKLPLQMNQLLEGDNTLLEEGLKGLLSGGRSSQSMGMRISVWCAEEGLVVDEATVAAETNGYAGLEGLSPLAIDREVCELWGVEAVPAAEREPVKSSVPTLLLAGGYDPATPPKWAKQVAQGLPNSHVLVFPGWGHATAFFWNSSCGMDAAVAFFDDPTKTPALECLDGLQPPKFVTSAD